MKMTLPAAILTPILLVLSGNAFGEVIEITDLVTGSLNPPISNAQLSETQPTDSSVANETNNQPWGTRRSLA